MDVFTAISLCSGYEGLGLGLKRAIPNLRTICYVENEAYAIANLVAKIKEKRLDDAPIWDDLKTFDPKPFTGLVDIIHSGFPCQPFSVAGKRKGTDDPRHLWPHIARIVQAVRPVWCFFENVPGHLTIGFPEVYRSLRTLGYSVEAGIFSAAEVGAPHRRERLFILAKSSRTGTGCICGTADGKHRPQDVRQENGQAGTTRAQPASPSIVRIQEEANGSDPQGRQNEAGNITGILGQDGRTRENQLADTGRNDGQRLQQTEQQKELPEKLSRRAELADACGTELSGRKSESSDNGKKRQAFTGNCCKWPSRPGQPQYEWEEPRVVEYASSRRCKQSTKELQTGGNAAQQTNKGQAQSSVGRAVNGPNCRVDRLRLLGNGVVPAQAEKAFRHLMRLFE